MQPTTIFMLPFIVATAVVIEVRRVAVQHAVITMFWRRPW